jgi:hypothetical protein
MAFAHERSASANGSGDSPAVTFSEPPVKNRLIVVCVAMNGTGRTLSAGTGWALLSQGSNSDEGVICWKVARAGESATQQPFTITNASPAWRAHGAIFRLAAGRAPVVDVEVANNDNDNTRTSTSLNPTDNITALFIGFAHTDSLDTFASRNFSGTAGTTIGTELLSNVSSTAWYLIASTSTSSWFSRTTTTSGANGVAYLAIFREATPAGSPFRRCWSTSRSRPSRPTRRSGRT